MQTWYQLFEHTADAVFGIDSGRRIRFLNRACERILGRGHEEALGHTCAEIVCGTDLTGKRLCGPRCPIPDRTSSSETRGDFDLLVSDGDHHTVMLNVSTHFVPKPLQSNPDDVRVFFSLRRVDCHRLIQRLTVPSCMAAGAVWRARLSVRELDVLRLAAEGMNGREIGERLSISEATVKNHFKRIFSKLGVHSRAEAVFVAIQNGLL